MSGRKKKVNNITEKRCSNITRFELHVVSLRKLFDQLLSIGGAIVLATECSQLERFAVMMERRYAENQDSAYILRPQSWLDSIKA